MIAIITSLYILHLWGSFFVEVFYVGVDLALQVDDVLQHVVRLIGFWHLGTYSLHRGSARGTHVEVRRVRNVHHQVFPHFTLVYLAILFILLRLLLDNFYWVVFDMLSSHLCDFLPQGLDLVPIGVKLALKFQFVVVDFPLVLIFHVLYGLVVGGFDELHLFLQSLYFFFQSKVVLLCVFRLTLDGLDVLLELFLAETIPSSSRLYRSVRTHVDLFARAFQLFSLESGLIIMNNTIQILLVALGKFAVASCHVVKLLLEMLDLFDLSESVR